MINWLHSRIHRPENGWDPVSDFHAEKYAYEEWASGVSEELIDTLAGWCNGLSEKTILDLGGGPGQYAVAFAKRGAIVTWYDVSNQYRIRVEERARTNGVSMQLAIGYLDEAKDILNTKFDIVFNRLCWYYGRNDKSFSRVIYDLVKPGGIGYIDTTHYGYMYDTLSTSARIRSGLNKYTGFKVGHPYPPRGRIEKLLAQYPLERLLVDYSSPMNDRIFFKKASIPGDSR